MLILAFQIFHIYCLSGIYQIAKLLLGKVILLSKVFYLLPNNFFAVSALKNFANKNYFNELPVTYHALQIKNPSFGGALNFK